MITVENAYGQLMAEGYLYSMPKRGFYVADIGNTNPKIRPVKKEAPGHGYRRGKLLFCGFFQ